MKKVYKKKRDRKKINQVKNENEIKSFMITFAIVGGFILVFYLIIVCLLKFGVFDQGYTPIPNESSKISYDEILIGNVFNKPEKKYYVFFDNYEEETDNVYINYLIESKELNYKVYKVDMSNSINAVYKSDKANKKATKASELKINDTTLIEINNGKIQNYLVGSAEIEIFLEKMSK